MQGHGLLFPMPPFLDSWGNWVQEPGCARTSVLGHVGFELIDGALEVDLIGGACARVHEDGHDACPEEGAREHNHRGKGLRQGKWEVGQWEVGRWEVGQGEVGQCEVG